MGKAVRAGQGGTRKEKLHQAMNGATQLPAARNNGCASPKYLRLRPCQAQKAEATVGCSQEHRHPAPVMSPFHAWSPSGSCSQKALSGGRCIFVFVPIKNKK